MVAIETYGSADQILGFLQVNNLTVTGSEVVNVTETLLGNLILGNASTNGGDIAWYFGGTQYNVFGMTAGGQLNILASTINSSNTWTGAQIFNAGIIFNAAGSIAGTSTHIEADGAGGSLILNVPTGKNLDIRQNGAGILFTDTTGAYLLPNNDGAFNIGSSWNRYNTITSNVFDVYHTAGDINPSAQLGDEVLKLGPGGATVPTTILSIGGNALVIGSPNNFVVSSGDAAEALGSNSNRWQSISLSAGAYVFHASSDGNPSAQLGDGFLALGLGGGTAINKVISTLAANNGVNLFYGGTTPTEAFRITTTPALQMADAINIVLGSTTGTKIGTATTQKLAFFNSAPIVQPSAVGSATGYAAGATAATFHSDDTYTGNVGATAYTINGIVANLKNLGLIAA